MTSFVLGASGFVGKEVVRQLRLRNIATVAHLRPNSAQRAALVPLWQGQGATLDETPWDCAALAKSIQHHGATVLYILIGTTAKRAKKDAVSGNIYEQVDYGLTKLACDAAALSSVAPRSPAFAGSLHLGPRIVYLSSIGASSSARSAYLKARGRAEQAVMSSGLPYMIARPAIITGDREDSRPGERAAAVVGDCALKLGRLFGAKRLANQYLSTTPDVLASALIRLATLEPANQTLSGAELR